MTLHDPMSRRIFTRQLILSPALAGAAGLIGPLSTPARAQTGTITIRVTNRSPSPKSFFFFQQPASYAGGATVYSNSLFNGTLPASNPAASAQLTYLTSLQSYAGVQMSNTAAPPVGQISGYNSTWMAIGLQAKGASNACSTRFQMAGSQLSLTPPVADPAVQPGAFRIASPTFNVNTYNFNAGSATLNPSTSSVVLSNFVLAIPATILDCQPVLVYFVGTGAYTPGTVINFAQSSQSAALCDASNGKYTFNVVYNSDGSWSVS
jgi:hypothetical protein